MQVTTVVGIIVAIVIILLGLKMLLRKPNDAAPSLDSQLHIDHDSQLPIIPRHVRNQLQADVSASPVPAAVDARVEPKLAATEAPSASSAPVSAADPLSESNSTAVQSADQVDRSAEQVTAAASDTELNQDQVTAVHADTDVAAAPDQHTAAVQPSADSPVAAVAASPEAEAAEAFNLNPNIEAAEIKEFDEESSILDKHLHEQQRFDDESTLANAETIIALNVYPNPRKALSGDKTLKVLLKYGLRFGELSCFHRYESADEVSPLMFSVLRITDEGPNGFDLETLSVEQVQGLAFFLALPHSNVQKGFDTMVSIAGLIAREVDGTVYDENNLEFTPQLKEHWRHKAIDYRSSQEV